jgi:asparaginyl-tRNA synthetase
MVEPEMAFADLKDDMKLAEDCLKYVLAYVLKHGEEDLKFLENRELQAEKQLPQNDRNEHSLCERLRNVVESEFAHMTYTEVIDALRNSKPFKKKKFKYPCEWGDDLHSEHERWLVEKHVRGPVIVTDLIGGSQREERLDVLKKKCADFNIPEDHVWWYLETRKFGSAKHCGFGMGFERLVMYCTGMSNIRDVIPFPRTPLSAEF